MGFEQMHNSGLSVADLVQTTRLGTAPLCAGAGGMHRQVRRVQWMEVLDDFAAYLASGDLLLTTAYNLRDDPGLQRDLARRMQDAGVVAMVIKCGYYLDTVPYVIRRQADEIDMPVFELPREVPFVELAQSIYEELVSRSYARLRRSAGLHRELVGLVVEGADLPTIVARAASVLRGVVAVQDARGRVLACSADGAPPTGPANMEVPVMARGLLHGRVQLWSGAPGEDDRQAVEQVATVVALEIARSQRELAAEREQLAQLTLALVGGAADPGACEREAAALGVPVPRPATVLRLARGARVDGSLVADTGEELVAVVPAGTPVDGPGGRADCGEPDELPEAFRRAGRARAIGDALHGPGPLHRYEQIEAYDILVGESGPARLAAVRDRVLGPLSPALRETLAAYLESGGSVAETARLTYVHRNTVHYRLRRIAALSAVDLARPEDRLVSELALVAERLAASTTPASSDGAHRSAGGSPTTS